MKKTDIFDKISKCIEEISLCSKEEIKEECRLKEDLGLDSLSLVAIIVGLEEKFQIQFDDSDLDPGTITDVKSLNMLVEKYV